MIIQTVNTGEVRVGSAGVVFDARGVGSCVVVCLYDKKKRQGGMAHVMLPDSSYDTQERGRESVDSSGLRIIRDASSAISFLVEELGRLGSPVRRLEAQIAGGAEMFRVWRARAPEERMGVRNTAAVRNALTSYNIPILSEEVGGRVGRSVRFSLDDGIIQVSSRKKSTM